MKRVAVTGSNGWVASTLVSYLKKKNITVVGLDIAPENPISGENADEFFRVDLTDLDALKKAFKGVDTVFHVAALFNGPEEAIERVNVLGTYNVVQACTHNHVQRLVFTSSGSVVFDGKDLHDATEDLPYAKSGLDPYNMTKAKAERIVLQANGDQGLYTCALRPHTIYGPGDNLGWPRTIESARAGKLKWRLVPDVYYSSYTYIDNIVHAEYLAAKELCENTKKVGGQVYNINDGQKQLFWTKLFDIGGIAADRSSMGVRSLPIPFKVVYFFCWLLWKFGVDLGNFTPFILSLASTNHYYSIEKAKNHLGYSPVIPHDQSWQKTKDYFKKWATNNPPPPPPPGRYLQYWLGFVSAVSLFGSLQALIGPETLRARQYSLAPELITPVTGRLFGAWTMITCFVRLHCAFDIHNRSLYRMTLITFWVALSLYSFECLIAHTIPWYNALPAFLVASTSIVWMTFFRPKRS